ncbi:MAG: antitoxin [Actinomycetota bacterium]
MRTTLNLDADVVDAARALARLERRSLGAVLSELARRGLAPREARLGERNGLPVSQVDAEAPPITEDMVQSGLDEAGWPTSPTSTCW